MEKQDSGQGLTLPELYTGEYYAAQERLYASGHPWGLMRWRNCRDVVDPQPGEQILDVACAHGRMTAALAGVGGTLTGLDSSLPAIRIAQRQFAGENVRFVAGDGRQLPLRDASVDKVAALDVTEHIYEDELRAMLAEIARVLRPGGRLAIHTPNPAHWVERMKAHNFIFKQFPEHIGLRPMHTLRNLVEAAGLQVMWAGYRPTYVPVVGLLERLLIRVPGIRHLFGYRILLVARKG